jgi:sigma-B regulation protein RsbU (phosphoserine phosphatase)
MGIANKIKNALGLGRKREAYDRLTRQLLEFGRAFSTVTDMSQLVPTMLGKIRDIMVCRSATLFLHSGDGKRYDLVHSRNVEINPRFRIRGGYYLTAQDKVIRWLLTNRTAFVLSKMTDIFNYFPEEERDILRFIDAEVIIGLEAHNRFIGILSVGRKDDGTDYDELELQLLMSISAQAALAFENNRLHFESLQQLRAKRELEIAGEMQRRLLPNIAPITFQELDINGFCIPSTEVGGDYYDYLMLNEEKMGVIIGDVAGHGMSAGMLMAMAKSCVNTAAFIDSSVGNVMGTLNKMVYDLEDRRAMMTAIYGVFDRASSTFTYSNAGHIFPYFYNHGTDKVETIESSSYPLGIRDSYAFPEQSFTLNNGDFILTCSDGLIEAMNKRGEIYGFERLHDIITQYRKCPSAELLSSIKDDFFSFLNGQPHADDLTLLAIRKKGE